MRIITRAEWGARPPKTTPARCAWKLNRMCIHHSAGPAPDGSLESSIRTVRAIQAFHQGPDRGWNDIGYAYVVDPMGRIFEGRGYQIWAAHSPGHNDEPSVCMLGTYGGIRPSELIRTAIWELMDELGFTVPVGHREWTLTTCPGDAGMKYVVKAGRPKAPSPIVVPGKLPYSNTLRLHMQTAAERKAGKPGRTWAGWEAVAGALLWIRKNGVAPTTTCAISWRGNVWRGPRDVANVAATLANKYL